MLNEKKVLSKLVARVILNDDVPVRTQFKLMDYYHDVYYGRKYNDKQEQKEYYFMVCDYINKIQFKGEK